MELNSKISKESLNDYSVLIYLNIYIYISIEAPNKSILNVLLSVDMEILTI